MAELEQTLSHAEWMEWLGLYRFDPWDDDRRDFMLAQQTALTWNCNVAEKDRKGIDHFLPLHAVRKASQPRKPDPSLKDRFLALARIKPRGAKHR